MEQKNQENQKIKINSKMLPVGYENYIDKSRIVAILPTKSNPVKKIIDQSRKEGMLIDMTSGKERKSLILTDANMIFLSARAPVGLVSKMEL